MPRSMNMGKYPAVFSQILRHFAGLDPQPIIIELESEIKATLIRFQFYSFEKAVRCAGRIDDASVLTKIMVKKRGRVLEFLDRDMDPDYADITRQVLIQTQGTKAPTVPAKSDEMDNLGWRPPNTGKLTPEEINQLSLGELLRREMLGEEGKEGD